MALTQPLRTTNRRELTPSARVGLWAIVAILCLGGGGLRAWQNHQRRAARVAWNAKCTQHNAVVQTTWDGMRRALRDARSRGVSKAEFERRYNDDEPLADPSMGHEVAATWTDDATGIALRLRFRNGKLAGWSSLSSGKTLAQPPEPTFDRVTESVRRFVAGWNSGLGPVLWIGLLVTCLAWRRYRAVTAELLLGVVVVTGTAWLVNPSYTLTRRGIFSNDMLFWAVIMLLVSSICLAASRRIPAPPTEPRCPQCDYNLTGNVSGVCPECGHVIPPSVRSLIRREPGRAEL